ncbi:hypothetical protein Moror_8652 [Moniliophthora roreri MCA 2997]|uniref:Uncharacterized protein n=2 Tax=Moniliophthora roreri TaxID=221103 RepID=V2X9V1_MONRO|nr:hypothetical protein Moror_8652 [Moniliophthora roreri MCA 2997]
MSSALRTSPRRRHRHHPYPRPIYLNPIGEDTAYEPRVDSLRDIMRSIEPGAVAKVDRDKEQQKAGQEGNNRLVVGGVLLLVRVSTFFTCSMLTR